MRGRIVHKRGASRPREVVNQCTRGGDPRTYSCAEVRCDGHRMREGTLRAAGNVTTEIAAVSIEKARVMLGVHGTASCTSSLQCDITSRNEG